MGVREEMKEREKEKDKETKLELEGTEAEVEKMKEVRKAFINKEKEYQKYLGFTLKGRLFKGKKNEKAQAKKGYEEAKEKYEKARAEYVGEHLDRFVDERMKLADGRAEKFEKGKWRKVWDWAGKELSVYRILEKKGIKIENRFSKALAKGLNARTLVSLGLLGTGLALGAGSMVGVGALAARRIYSGAATGMGSYELMRMAGEKYPRLTDKKLKSMDYSQAEKIMAQYEVRAKLKGEKVSGNENYQKLKDKYQKLLIGESEKADKKADVLIKAADKQLEKIDKGAKRDTRLRKMFAVGLGVLVGGAGLNRLAEHVAGPSEEAMVLAEREGVEMGEKLAGQGTVEAAAEAAKSAAEEIPERFTPEKFEFTVQANEGYIHEARKAIVEYADCLCKDGAAHAKLLTDFTPAQRVWMEDRLWDLYREAHPEAAEKILRVGDKVEFSADDVKTAFIEVQEKFGGAKAAGLTENLKDYVNNVNWDRYKVIHHPQVGDTYGWEWDNGVKAVDWQTETEALEKLAEAKPATPEVTDLLNEKEALEVAKAAGDNYAVVDKVHDMFHLRPDEYEVLKDVSVHEFVSEYSYWNPPEDMIQSNDHMELWRKLKLRDMLTHYLHWHPAKEGITVHEYLKECWRGEAIKKIAEAKPVSIGAPF